MPTQWLAEGSEAAAGSLFASRIDGTMLSIWDDTIPRGPFSSVINKLDSSVKRLLVIVILCFVYNISKCYVGNRLTIDNK